MGAAPQMCGESILWNGRGDVLAMAMDCSDLPSRELSVSREMGELS